ncbi:MAG: CoA transferase [Candidatus Rokubacteria bacterium]|nr:CoA transferase [Candidatus Rokubacteria bacterium]
MTDPQPFAGLEVVEFGQFIAVPYCGQLLADGGAHVIKVETLTGDPVRALAPLAPGESRHFISRNRGKHSLPLDLKHPRAAGIIDELVARADVVLTNLRPGLAAELGLDHTTLSARHPRLIVGNVSAFGPRGPDAGLGGMDMVIQARTGLMVSAGRLRDGVPQAVDPPITDYYCATALAFGIAAALLRRTRTGRGGEVDVSLLISSLVLQNNAMVRVHRADGARHEATLTQLAGMRAAGAPFEEQAALNVTPRPANTQNIYYRTYATKDAAIAVACVGPGMQRAFMRALELTDEAHQGRPVPADVFERYYTDLGRRAEAVVRQRTTAEWRKIFDAVGIPAGEVRLPIEMLDDPQVLANEMVYDLDHPAIGPVRAVAPPVKMDAGGFRPSPATPPFGSEARAILRSLGFAESDVETFVAEGVTRERLGE